MSLIYDRGWAAGYDFHKCRPPSDCTPEERAEYVRGHRSGVRESKRDDAVLNRSGRGRPDRRF